MQNISPIVAGKPVEEPKQQLMPANMPPTVDMRLHSAKEQKTKGMIPEKVNESILDPPSCSNDNVSTNALQHMQQVLAQTQATMETRFEKILDTWPQTKGDKRNKGKPKSYGCKQCEHVSTSKYESWQHVRTHISADKLLNCPKCDFVTEYKNHLEYHLKNHVGNKPFKCKKCNYSCVNRSMLNSHMKSHSSYYQYRCRDCTYTTKYCHSMKLHLRNYGHQQAIGQLPIRQRHRSEAETDVMDQIQQQSMMQRSSSPSRANLRKAADETFQKVRTQNAQSSSVTTQPSIATASAVDLWASAFICNHCDIAFRNSVMYNIHMGYHDYENPFKCNRCGTECNDSLDIFIHIAQVKH